jgi:glucose/arabinose dehydrogenase
MNPRKTVLAVVPLIAAIAAFPFVACDSGTKESGTTTGTGHSVVTTAGPTGGTVALEGATLTVPAGALASDQAITITSTMRTPQAGAKNLSPIYEFGPAGLVFAKPVILSLAYTGEAAAPVIEWSDSNETGFTALPTTVNQGVATAAVTHFSLGFVADPATTGNLPAPEAGPDAPSVGLDANLPDAPDATTMDGGALSDGGSDAPDAGDADGEGGAEAGRPSTFCGLPGSVVYSGGKGTPVLPQTHAVDFGFLHLPDGFCAHPFAHVPHAREARFAPGGELFVASPSRATAGGAAEAGLGAIAVLPDDDHDGYADVYEAANAVVYVTGIDAVQGMAFAGGKFHYQNDQKVYGVPYTAGDRMLVAPPTLEATITQYYSATHWPRTMDADDTGTLYVTNGGDEGELCVQPAPFHGGILKVDGTAGGAPVAQGLRNAIALRCQRGKNRCYALELTRDFSATQGGRDKLIPVHAGDDWGFPCCATAGLPFPAADAGISCGGAAETVAFSVSEVPFSLDFESGLWPAPWKNKVFVAMHGTVGSWAGARVVALATDANGAPVPASDVDGGTASITDFATGWDDGTLNHGRPTRLLFAPDGRLFVADDWSGLVVWVAPTPLAL